jgi:hypothetical protein
VKRKTAQATLFDAPTKPPVVEAVKETVGAAKVRFDGSDYSPKRDDVRLAGQLLRVFNCMRDSHWRTLEEIGHDTGDPQASISAQLRHLRKEKFGSHTVNKRNRGDGARGLFEYQLVVNGTK